MGNTQTNNRFAKILSNLLVVFGVILFLLGIFVFGKVIASYSEGVDKVSNFFNPFIALGFLLTGIAFVLFGVIIKIIENKKKVQENLDTRFNMLKERMLGHPAIVEDNKPKIKCRYCSAPLNENDTVCPTCGANRN